MSLCLRVDLDYVPWDTPDAAEFGHGEPALFLRLTEMARTTGVRLHVFASNRVLRAFPAGIETVLSEGHDLDWLCKHPGDAEREAEARHLFSLYGHAPLGLAVKDDWPVDLPLPSEWRFLSAPAGPEDRLQIVATRPVREASRAGLSVRGWTDALKTQVREAAARGRPVTAVLRPQALARFDSRLGHVREIVDLALAVELPVRTLRERLAIRQAPSPPPTPAV